MSTVVDASVIVAVLLAEDDADDLIKVWQTSALPRHCSLLTIYEAAMALVRKTGCSVQQARFDIYDLLENTFTVPSDIDAEQLREALRTFDRFGKGRHPAQLNMGDCFTYALAKAKRAQLIFKGRDFAHPHVQADLKA